MSWPVAFLLVGLALALVALVWALLRAAVDFYAIHTQAETASTAIAAGAGWPEVEG